MRWTKARSATLTVLAVLTLVTLSSGSSRADDPPYPGLPPTEVPPPPLAHRSWGGTAFGATAYVQRARQWVRTPLMTAAFDINSGTVDPNPDPSHYNQCTVLNANSYLVAPAGGPHNYGASRDITVHTVAFGSIPVDATVQLEQARAAGLPVPIRLSTQVCSNTLGAIEVPDNEFKFSLFTHVTALQVDGVPVNLGGGCRTRSPGTVDLHGKGYYQGWDGTKTVPAPATPYWDNGHYNVSSGGLLTGTVDVPAFAGCTTADGDDLSRLLTATISGTGFPLQVIQGSAFACSVNNLPPKPGASTPESVPCNTNPAVLPAGGAPPIPQNGN
ncbi:MAG: hypothetical protein FWE71_07515 [Nocardioidaceae bacterium]|nr:hypothetical protein [Nocardioidaceae bacterium]MCL2611836.1 hypothetical protein [Nocardioidaceae bacterium]